MLGVAGLSSLEFGLCLGCAGLLFTLGAVGFLIRQNLLTQLMSIELMLGASNLCLVVFNRIYPERYDGQLFALFVVTVAAAEAAVGLAIAVNLYRLYQTFRVGDAQRLKH